MKEKLLPYDKEMLSHDAYFRIVKSAREKAGIDERAMFEMKNTNNKRKIGRKIVIFAAAALFMMPVAAGAYAIKTGSLDIFQKYHTGDTASFEHDLESTVQSVSNNDIVFAIDGIVADDFNCDIIVSVYALNEEGKKVVDMLENPEKTKELYAFQQIFLEHEGADNGEDFKGDTASFANSTQWNPDLNNDTEYHMMIDLDMKRVNREKSFKLTEQWSGLSMEFSLAPYLESYRVYADEGTEGACHYVTLSQLGVHIIGTPDDISPIGMYHYLESRGEDGIPVTYVNYADGTSVRLTGLGYGSVSDDGETYEYMGETFTDFDYRIEKRDENDVAEFINAKDAVSVRINGIEYKKR